MIVVRLLYRIALRSSTDQLSLIAAGIAFYALLAVFPGIAALVAFAGLVTPAEDIVLVFENLSEILPEEAATIILAQAKAVAAAPSGGLSLALFVGLGISIYMSTRATTSLIHGLNVTGRYQETRSFFKYWAVVVAMTLATFIGAVIMFVLLVGLPTVLAFLPPDIGVGQFVLFTRWVVTLIVLLGLLEIFYRFGPSTKRRKWVWFSPGIFVAVGLWFAASLGFSYYVSNFAQYNEIFGSLGGVVILLTWIWISAFVVLLGALVDNEISSESD